MAMNNKMMENRKEIVQVITDKHEIEKKLLH